MRLPVTFVVLSFVFAVGCVDRQAQAQAKQTESLIKDPTTSVETVVAASTTVEDTLDVTGSIQTSDDASATAIVAGPIVAVYVKDGDQVSAGQVIAKQDDSDYQARLSGARSQSQAAKSALDQAMADAAVGPQKSTAQVAASQARLDQANSRLKKLLNGARPEEKQQAQAQVDKAKSDMETAKLTRDRTKTLYDEGAVSKAQLEQAENAYAASLSGYESALANQRLVQNASRYEDIAAAQQDVQAAEQQLAIDQANKRLDVLFTQRVESASANWQAAKQNERLAQIALSNTVVRSPFRGRISGKPAQAGTYAAPGVPIARIVGVGGAYFEAEVPESQIVLLQQGISVGVTLDALPGVKVEGTLVAVSPQATSSGRLFFARVRLDSVPEGVRSGMFARGVAVLGKRSGVILLPSEAIIKDGQSAHVFLVNGDKAKRAEVKLGVTRDGTTEVIGLNEGDKVIVKGQDALADGSPINAQASKSAPVDKKE